MIGVVRKLVIRLLCLLLVIPLAAVAQLPGSQPPMVRFTPGTDGYPQNFSIAVDNRDTVYVGNAEGVLIFDGEAWQLKRLPNREIVRWLVFDGKSRVYVGGFDAFGYIERNRYGGYNYTELSSLFAEDLGGELFADIWSIQVAEQGVFFVGLEHLFLFNPNTASTNYWKHPGSFGPITGFDGRVWLQWRGEGIKSFDGEDWHLVSAEAIPRDFLAALLPVEGELIAVNLEGDWYRGGEEGFEPIPGTSEVPLNSTVAHGFVAGGTTIGLTTSIGKLVFHDLESGDSEVIGVSTGFVPAAVRTSDGHILVVDDLGFTSVTWPARWRILGPESGLAGSVAAIRMHDADLYVLTSSGVFRRVIESENRFERLAWTDDEAWDMVVQGNDILLADSYAIKAISSRGELTIIDDDTTARLLQASRFHEGLVFAGTEYGLQILQKKPLGWQIVAEKNDLENITVTHIVELNDKELLLGSARGGIFHVKYDVDIASVSLTFQEPVPEGLQYGNKGEGAYLFHVGGQVVASTAEGLYRYANGVFVPDDFMGLSGWRKPGESVELKASNGLVWAFYYDRVLRFDGDGWHEESVSNLVEGAITILSDYRGELLVGGMGSILSFDVSVPVPRGLKSGVTLTGASVTRGAGTDEIRRLPISDIRLSTEDERLSLQFALTDFARPDQIRFRSRLLPVENTHSAWSETGLQSFVGLGPGRYTLDVEARDSLGDISRVEVPIVIAPRWYEALWFQLIVGSVAVLMIVVLVRLYSMMQARALTRERDLLEQKVAERTRALQSANAQLDQMAHLDGLTQIPNRRKLDTYLEEVRLQCVERGRVMAVALFDIDHFKQYNDTHGHQAGDALLVDLANLLSRNLRRAEDLVARYGGEEFLVALPGADTRTAREVIENMRRFVESSPLNVTVSAGLHVYTPDEDTSVEDMIAKADKALYEAKAAGRNQVVVI